MTYLNVTKLGEKPVILVWIRITEALVEINIRKKDDVDLIKIKNFNSLKNTVWWVTLIINVVGPRITSDTSPGARSL